MVPGPARRPADSRGELARRRRAGGATAVPGWPGRAVGPRPGTGETWDRAPATAGSGRTSILLAARIHPSRFVDVVAFTVESRDPEPGRHRGTLNSPVYRGRRPLSVDCGGMALCRRRHRPVLRPCRRLGDEGRDGGTACHRRAHHGDRASCCASVPMRVAASHRPRSTVSSKRSTSTNAVAGNVVSSRLCNGCNAPPEGSRRNPWPLGQEMAQAAARGLADRASHRKPSDVEQTEPVDHGFSLPCEPAGAHATWVAGGFRERRYPR